jgi:hypothetical protein
MSIFKNQVIKSSLTAGMLSVVLMNPAIAQAAYWGDLRDNGCKANGEKVHSYSAILWGIPWGASWENACATTPLSVGGYSFSGASACVNDGTHMWGVFYFRDDTCGL